MKNSFLMIVCSIILFGTSDAQQQRGKFQRPGERIESYKKVRIIESLKLDEEIGVKVIARYNKHRETVKALEEERGELMDKIDSQVQSNASDVELQKSFNEIFAIEAKLLEARKKYIESLHEVLTTKQVAEYVVFERNFMKDLRNAAKEVHKERMKQ